MPDFEEHPIFGPKIKPKTLTRQALLDLIAVTLAEIERDASMEGSITYSWGEEHGTYLVHAFIRTGNDMGQGGSIIVRDPDA